jgi:hypothetical protein
MFYVELEGHLRSRLVERALGGELTLGLAVSVIGSGHWGTQYDVSPDGLRFYFIGHTPATRPSDINVVIGWSALLK